MESPPGRPTTSLAHEKARQISKRVVLSYVLDWIVIIVIAAAGGVLYKITGYQHAFAINDVRISYPLVPNTVSISVVAAIAFAAPAIIIAILSLLLVPRRPAPKGSPNTLWRRRLWEWNTGWMGLALALAATFFITSGLKDLVGKPRPDLLARCDPDLSNIAAHLVGGLGMSFEDAPVIVNPSICRQTDKAILNDGFASFPSGHSSFSWAGLLYLSLWLAAKFAITIPFLAPSPYVPNHSLNEHPRTAQALRIPPRSQAAAPPLYLLVLVATPIIAALYVCASRWADYQHEGFDIIAGSLLGAGLAWLSFRWYHLPLRRGAGWAWGARSKDRAFYAGIGEQGFVGEEGWESETGRRDRYEDLELGSMGAGGSGEGLAGGVGRPE